MAKSNKGMTISLEFVAEMLSMFYVMKKFPAPVMQGAFHPQMVANFISQLGKEPDHLEWLRNNQIRALEGAINDTSALAVLEEELSDNAVTRRIRLLYALNRYVYFEVPMPPNPRIDPQQKDPTTKDNDRIMQRVWETLQNVPLVQEEIEKQRKAGRLREWKKEERSKAISTYHKIKERWPEKFNRYRGELRGLLLEGDDSEKAVNTPDKNSRAKNSTNLASNKRKDSKSPPKLASKTKRQSGSRKQS